MSHSTAAAAQVEQRDEDDDNCMFFDEDDHNSNRNADDDAFDDLLNLSAHSSGAGSLCQRKDNTNDGDDDDATTTSSSSQCPDGDDDDGVIADDDEEVDDEAGCAATSEHDVNSSDAAVVRSLRKHNEKVQRLSSDAQLLMNRFHAFFQLHPQLPGLSKLRTRFEREVELATEAVTGQPMARGSHKQQQQQRPPPRNTTAPSVNRPSYIKCNCLPLLELTMHVLENEPNVVSVMHPVNPTLLQKVVQRGNVKAAAAASPAVVAPNAAAAAAATSGGGCRSGFLDQWQLPSVAFEVDIITCGGLRWIKIKGTSRRNLDLELAACADRRPFSSVLENIVRGATCCRQPFGIIPKVDVLIFYRPSLDVLQECGDLVENATSTARVAYAAANNSRNCRSMITKRAVAANGDDSSDDDDDVDVAPITTGQLLLARRPKDECVDVTFRIFESSLKSYLVKHASSSSLSPSSPANCRDKVVEEEEESNNKKITWGAIPLARRFQLSPLFWSRYFLPPLELSIDFINFDVTALVALCSDTCNGFAGHPIPKHSILEEQSFSEAKDPSILDYIEHCLQKYTHDVIVVESSSSSGISTNKTAIAEGSSYVDESSGEVSSVRDVMSKHISAVGGNASKLRVATVKGLGLNEEQREKLGFTMDDEVDENGFVVSSSSSSKLFFASQTLRALQQEASNEPSSSSSSAGAAAAGSGVVRRRHVRKNWIVSDVALSEFLWIVGTIAGPSEYRRAAHLLQYMFVVSSESLAAALLSRGGAVAPVASSSPEHPSQLPPPSSPSSSVLRSMDAVFHLENTGKLADRHKAVFGLGNAVHAISISANKQFTQAARDQGIEVCVCHHPSRALTERKRLGGDRMDGPRRPPDLQRQVIETI